MADVFPQYPFGTESIREGHVQPLGGCNIALHVKPLAARKGWREDGGIQDSSPALPRASSERELKLDQIAALIPEFSSSLIIGIHQ